MQKNTSLGESMSSITKKIKIECEEKIKLNISKKIYSDIFYTHLKYPGEEWSGYIYFRPIGTIDKPSELVIDIEEFILMDLGTVGATEITPSGEQIVDMFEKRPQLMELKQGLLHTHHNMQVFFSGTDWDTLLEHSSSYPYFLSLIVNAKGHTIAKVGLQGYKEGQVKYSYKFGKGFMYKEPVLEKEEVIYVYDCIINIENDIDEEFDKLLVVKANKEEAVKLSNSNQHFLNSYSSYNSYRERNYNTKNKGKHFDDWEQPSLPFEKTVKRDIKGRTISFLTSLILQDETGEQSNTITYDQSKQQWNESIGIELADDFTEFVDCIIDDLFDKIFGVVTRQELFDIKTHIHMIMGDKPCENAIKPLIISLLNTIETYEDKEESKELDKKYDTRLLD